MQGQRQKVTPQVAQQGEIAKTAVHVLIRRRLSWLKFDASKACKPGTRICHNVLTVSLVYAGTRTRSQGINHAARSAPAAIAGDTKARSLTARRMSLGAMCRASARRLPERVRSSPSLPLVSLSENGVALPKHTSSHCALHLYMDS